LIFIKLPALAGRFTSRRNEIKKDFNKYWNQHIKGWALIMGINKYNGCYNSHIACKDKNVGNDWIPYAKPQRFL